MPHPRGQSTPAIRGTSLKDAHGAQGLPMYHTTTSAFESSEALLDGVDGRKTRALCTRHGLSRGTFASPVDQRPLELGAAIVVYPATRYLGGDTDVSEEFLRGSADPGGAESLASQPVTATHQSRSADERERRGITDSMTGLSVGLEDAADLIAGLHRVLDAVTS